MENAPHCPCLCHPKHLAIFAPHPLRSLRILLLIKTMFYKRNTTCVWTPRKNICHVVIVWVCYGLMMQTMSGKSNAVQTYFIQGIHVINLITSKVVFLKSWDFGIHGIHYRERSHSSQSLTVIGKPPYDLQECCVFRLQKHMRCAQNYDVVIEPALVFATQPTWGFCSDASC
jgi:hypothetical protein